MLLHGAKGGGQGRGVTLSPPKTSFSTPRCGAQHLLGQHAAPLGRQVLEGEDEAPMEAAIALQRPVMHVRPLLLLLQPVQPAARHGEGARLSPRPHRFTPQPWGRSGAPRSPGHIDVTHPLPCGVDVPRLHVARVPHHAAQLVAGEGALCHLPPPGGTSLSRAERSPLGLAGSDVHGGPGGAEAGGEDVHPHLHLALCRGVDALPLVPVSPRSPSPPPPASRLVIGCPPC